MIPYPRPPVKPLNIVLIEDDDGDAKAIRRAFDRARVANPIIRARDGIEALELLRSDKVEPPYVLLVDINMPRMNGHEFVTALRADKALRRVIVFMLSTSRSMADVNTAYDNNVAGYILKDEAGSDFLQMINMLDDFWHVVEMPQLGK